MSRRQKCGFQVEALEGRIALGAVAHGIGPAPAAHVQTAATSVQPAVSSGQVLSSGPLLQRGSTGKYVTILQTELKMAGYGSYLGNTGPHHDGVDGIYGSLTENAVRQFQKGYNYWLDTLGYPRSSHIKVDGIVGPQTWTALENWLAYLGKA